MSQPTPAIHLNGTSADALLEAKLQACEAVLAAIQAVREDAPNGRDYYPLGEHLLEEAQLVHEHRVDTLRSVLRALEEEAAALVEAS